MKKAQKICHTLFGFILYLTLFVFLTVPLFNISTLYVIMLPLVLLFFILLEMLLRFKGSIRRIYYLLLERLSGCRMMGILLLLYILCDIMNLTYSPVKQQILDGYPILFSGIILWLGILLYADNPDKLDNLLMSVTLSGLTLSISAMIGFSFSDARWAERVAIIGLITGCIFFASAQYNKRFKAVVVSLLCIVMLPGITRTMSWAAPSALAQNISLEKQSILSASFEQLKGFRTPEIILGRGSGYDIALNGSQGVGNFLLADLLGGGVVRFSISLALWLCIGYCIGMLFLHVKGIPFIYLIMMGFVFYESFTALKTGFLSDPLFLLACAMIIAEQTMIKKGKLRPVLLDVSKGKD